MIFIGCATKIEVQAVRKLFKQKAVWGTAMPFMCFDICFPLLILYGRWKLTKNLKWIEKIDCFHKRKNVDGLICLSWRDKGCLIEKFWPVLLRYCGMIEDRFGALYYKVIVLFFFALIKLKSMERHESFGSILGKQIFYFRSIKRWIVSHVNWQAEEVIRRNVKRVSRLQTISYFHCAHKFIVYFMVDVL